MISERKSLLGIEELEADEIIEILDAAASFQEVQERSIKKVPALRGQTVVNLFFEASTRTRSPRSQFHRWGAASAGSTGVTCAPRSRRAATNSTRRWTSGGPWPVRGSPRSPAR